MIKKRACLLHIIVVGLGLCFSFPVFADVIRTLQIEGNRRIEKEVIANSMSLKEEHEFSHEQLSNDIKAIYTLGFFSDVKAKIVKVSPGYVRLEMIVKEHPIIRNVSFTGNKKIETEELQKDVDIALFSILDEAKLKEAVSKMKKHYDQEGFYLVDIVPEIKPLSPQEVEVVFRISENRRVRIKRITILGNQALSDRQIRKVMATKEGHIFSFLTKAGTFDQEKLNFDIQGITYLYHDHGYLDAKVGVPETYLSPDKKSLYVTIGVTEGVAYQVGTISIGGDLLFSEEELKKPLHLKTGELFKRSLLEKDIQGVTEKYSDEGYFYVSVRENFNKDPDKRIVDITLQIEKGLKVYFERISITGNDITRDKVIRRELKVTEGELFHLTRLRKSLERIKRLGYFEDVNIATPRGSRDDQLNLNIDVKEKPTGTLTVGAGYSSSDKFIFNAEVSKDNFLGLGLRGEVSAQLSGKRQLFNIGVTEPHLFDSPWLVHVNAFRSDVEYTDFDRSSMGGELRVGRELFELVSGSVAYRLENVTIKDVNPAIVSFFEDGITSAVTLAINRDSRDNRIFTKKGTFSTASVELAGGPMGGDNEFWKLIYNARAYYPLLKPLTSYLDDVIFRLQGTVGFIGSVAGEDVPIFERFFLGGINSVRGYESRSIGPTRQVVNPDPASGDYEFIIGGNKQLIFNAEVDFPLIPPVNIRGVGFFDAGNAFDDGEMLDITDLKMSFGGGIRWYSPLGPLRFEFGIPINADIRDEKSPFEFTIGTSF